MILQISILDELCSIKNLKEIILRYKGKKLIINILEKWKIFKPENYNIKSCNTNIYYLIKLT